MDKQCRSKRAARHTLTALACALIGVSSAAFAQRTTSGRHGTVQLGSGEVVHGPGTLDPAVVERVLRANLGRVRRCYERVLAHHPTMSGRVILYVSVDAGGRTTGVSTAAGEQPRELGSCITGTLMSLRYPAPERGPVNFRFLLDLSPEP